MGLEENKAIVQRLFDAINNGALDELLQVVVPDVVDHNAVIFMQPGDPGGVAEGIRMLLQGFPDLHLTTQEFLEAGQVVVRFTMSGPTPATTEASQRRPSSTSIARRSLSYESLTAGWPSFVAQPIDWEC